MSQWANEHPEQMAEIAALPPSQQNAALREAIGYDPDAIRDRLEEHSSTSGGLLSHIPGSPAGSDSLPKGPAGTSSSDDHHCDVCGAPPKYHHLSYCDLRGEA